MVQSHGVELMVTVTCAQGPAQSSLMKLAAVVPQSFTAFAGHSCIATWDACENTRGDAHFPGEFCNLNVPWWYKQEERTLGILRTSS